MKKRWPVMRQVDPIHVRFEKKTYVYFGGCDYLRMSWHPEIRRAVRDGLNRHGLNVAASRSTTGNHPLYRELEEKLAGFFGCEDAILVSNGYMASMAAGQGLAKRFGRVVMDAKAHACLRDAAGFLAAPVQECPHRQVPDLDTLRQGIEAGTSILAMTDGLYSQDGSVAPLPEWTETLGRHDWLLVDDAHGVGILGHKGRGALEWTGARHPRLLLTATLSKAFGVYGGMILGGARLLDHIRSHSRMLVGNTPLPLPLAEAALTSLRLMRISRRRDRLTAHADYLKSDLREGGWKNLPDSPAPIVSGTPRSAAAARRVAQALRGAGIYPSLIHYPGAGREGYFRFALSSEHTREQLQELSVLLLEHRTDFLDQD
jgi:7-keto-8-aminopelargonate synthetase-like enzyme